MPDENQNNENQSNSDGVNNSDIKNHPLFLKVTGELASLKTKIEDRKTADEEAATKADQAKLLEEKNFKDLLASKETEYTTKLAALEKSNTEKDLMIELTAKGFSNKVFLNGAIASYDKEAHGDFSKYADTLSSDAVNAQFLSAQKPKPKDDIHGSNGPITTLTPVELKAQLNSTDPTKRAAARAIAKENALKTGNTGVS